MILMYKYLCYNNVNSVILTQFSCDLLYVFILVQSFTLFVGKIALMANVLICYNWMPTLNKVSCILYLVSSSCCIELIVTLFICVLVGLPYVALDWLWLCLSLFLSVILMLHWIDCDIVYFCSHGSSSCRIGLIVALFICVFMVLTRVALDWLWHY